MLTIGTLVDHKYRVLGVVGRGGMSVVYVAINEKANKTWAIKEVLRDGVADYETVRQGLIAETNLLKQLHHKYLPSIVDVIEDADTFLIVMDYIEGIPLSRVVREQGPQPQEVVVGWALQLCEVLDYLHTCEPAVIYRDMKPDNIMLRPDGTVCLIDFGIARQYKDGQETDTTCLGTVGYAAPEQFGGMGQTDARTDLYALGATMYHLLTGRNPAQDREGMTSLWEVAPSVSQGVARIIATCTQADPEQRYQSASELAYALQHYEQADDRHRLRQKCKLAGFLAVFAVALVLAVGGIRMGIYASGLAADHYEVWLDEAAQSLDYEEQVDLCLRAIALPEMAGRPEAYLQLIDIFEDFYEDGDVFTTEEEAVLLPLLTEHMDELQQDEQGYRQICFAVGKLYWYFYDDGSGSGDTLTRARYARKWFAQVLESDTESGMAAVYVEVADFYTQIAKNIILGEDAGTYGALFTDLQQLMEEVALDAGERDIVRLELCALVQDALRQYALKGKGDGITYEQMQGLYEDLSEALEDIQPLAGSTLADDRDRMLGEMEITRQAVEDAYQEM